MKAIRMGHVLMFGVFFGFTLSHIINGFVAPAIMTAIVTLLFVPGIVLFKNEK